MKIKKLLALLMALMMAVCVFAACGDDKAADNKDDEKVEEKTGEKDPAEEPAEELSEEDAVKATINEFAELYFAGDEKEQIAAVYIMFDGGFIHENPLFRSFCVCFGRRRKRRAHRPLFERKSSHERTLAAV